MFMPLRIPDLLKLAHPDRDVSGEMKAMSDAGKNRTVLRAQ